MQIMNLDKLFKRFERFIGASKVVKDFPDSVIFVDGEGYITDANNKACECFNLHSGINLVKLSDFIENGMNCAKDSVKLKKPVLASVRVDGKEYFVEINASKRQNGYCLAIRDITKLTNESLKEKKIEQFNGEKNAMIVKIEDEIKSPINSILGFSKSLLEDENITEKQRKYLGIIRSNAQDLYDYLDKFIEFTYAESLLYEPEMQRFDVVLVLKNILKGFELQFREKNLELVFDADLWEKRTIYTDIKALKKYLKNIIEVSLSMTKSGGITIRLSSPDEAVSFGYGLKEHVPYLQISIQDTGEGIEQENKKYLCNPYFWIEKGKKYFTRALKLGSASILIKRSEGYFDISSEVMQGTLFNIIIPVEKDENE